MARYELVSLKAMAVNTAFSCSLEAVMIFFLKGPKNGGEVEPSEIGMPAFI